MDRRAVGRPCGSLPAASIFDQLPECAIEGMGTNGAVAYDETAGFRHEEKIRNQDNATDDGQEPEYPAPTEILRYQAAYYGPNRRREDDGNRGEGDIRAAFGRCYDIGHDSLTQ